MARILLLSAALMAVAFWFGTCAGHYADRVTAANSNNKLMEEVQ
jgi:hypothetical protein